MLAGAITAIVGGLVAASGWVAAYLAIRARSKAELAEAKTASELALAQRDIKAKDERIRSYMLTTAAWGKATRNLPKTVKHLGMDAAVALLNGIVSEQAEADEPAGDGPDRLPEPVAGDPASDAYEGDLL